MKYIKMSDLIIYRPAVNNESAGQNFSTELYEEENFIALIGSSFNHKTDSQIKAIMMPNDTRVYNRSSKKTLTSKDLLINANNCSPGCVKLQVVDPACWLKSIDENNCLIQLHGQLAVRKTESGHMLLALKCEWPDASAEWLNRTRSNNWPKPEVIDKIKESGCYVIPKCPPTCSCSSSEWKFIFHKAERILEKDALSEDQLYCLHILKLALDSVRDNMFTVTQLKHVLFFICEEMEVDKWKTELADCVWIFLERLKEFIRCRHLPNFFMPEINLLSEDVDDDFISRCIDYINIVQKHPFVTLFFLCNDNSFFQMRYKILFDSLAEDSRRYALTGDLDTSIRQCFLPIVADGVSEVVRLNNYLEAVDRCQEATKHMNMLFKEEKKLQLEDVISKVILLSYRDVDKWMFAFAADQKLGTVFTETVCTGLELVSVFNYYGPFLVQTLRMSSPDILIPRDFVNDRNIPETTCYMLEILEKICPYAVFQEVILFLLNGYLPRLVENASKYPLTPKFLTKIIGKVRNNLPTRPESIRADV